MVMPASEQLSSGEWFGDHINVKDLVSSIGDGLFLVDSDGRVIYVDERLEELSGVKSGGLSGCPYNFLFGQLAKLGDNARQTLRELLTGLDRLQQMPRVDVLIHQLPSRHLQVELYSLRGSGGKGNWGGLIRDVSSEYIENAQWPRALLALVNELRTSLVFVKGAVTTLLSDSCSWGQNEQHEFLESINENAEQSIQLLETVRDVSRLELGDLEMKRRPTELKRLVHHVIQKITAQTPDVIFELDIPHDLPLIEMDPLRMGRALQSLLNSIVKFSSGNAIQIAAQCVGDHVDISILYQGVNISGSLAGNDQFDDFFQQNGGSFDFARDLELSLHIARSILTAHKGHIRIEKTPLQEIVVHITLSVESQPSSIQQARGKTLAGPSHPTLDSQPDMRKLRQGPKILVVEDDLQMFRYLKIQLERGGYRVIGTDEGAVGMSLASIEAPDMILLDVYLPDSNGFDICRQLREFSSVPIIMITGSTREEDLIQGLNVGADDYLSKPLGAKELLARVQANLRRAYLADLPDRSRSEPVFKDGDLVIDFARREVTMHAQPVDLTPIEYKLLHYLAANAGRILTHEQLVSKVWGPMFRNETQYLWVNISRLRAKIEPDPSNPTYIRTERGVGYCFCTLDSDPSGNLY